MDVLSNWESSCAASSVASFWCLPSATPALMLEPESTLMHLNLQRHTNTLTTKVQYWSWNQSCYFWTLTVDIFSPWRMKMLQHPSNELPLDFFHEIHFDISVKRCWYCSCWLTVTTTASPIKYMLLLSIHCRYAVIQRWFNKISSRWGRFTCQKKLKTHETIAEEAVTTGDVIKNAQDTQELNICVKRCSTQWSRSFRLKLKKMISRVKCSLRIKI